MTDTDNRPAPPRHTSIHVVQGWAGNPADDLAIPQPPRVPVYSDHDATLGPPDRFLLLLALLFCVAVFGSVWGIGYSYGSKAQAVACGVAA